MYGNNILNVQESTTVLNACTKKLWKLIEGTTYITKIPITLIYFFFVGRIERKKWILSNEFVHKGM